MKNHCLFVIVINLLVAGLLLWVGNSRMNDLHGLHDHIATESATIVADNVTHFIGDKNRLINIFSENEIDLIRRLAKSPNNTDLQEQLDARVKRYFPNYFTFTIADKHGEPLLEDFDGYVGDICLKDIKRFANHKQPLPRIHPNSEGYHFDIMTHYGGDEGILFVSFQADILGRILKSAEAYNHQLLLIMEAGLDLIEVTADGARNHWVRDDYRMLREEKNRILAMKNVPGSVWTAIDLYKPALFDTTKSQIVSQAIATMTIFIVASFIFLYSMSRTNKRRAEAEKARDDFLSTISHDLRTPLNAIRGSLGLVIGGVGGNLPKQADSLARTALKNTERMIALVNDLLDLRKLEAGNIKLDMQPVDLLTIIQNSIDLSTEYGKGFGVTFNLLCHNNLDSKGSGGSEPCDDKRIMIMANERRIEQAVNNLLSNAAKYGAANETVEVSVTVSDGTARVEIRDKGPGVAPSFQPRLFEKFPQAIQDNAPQSVGHGLAIVNYIMKLHKGEIGYETRPGYGAIFFFELPILPEA